jgi:Tfp pilus assembly protein PilF
MNLAEYAFDQAIMAIRGNRRQDALDMLAEVLRLNHNHADAWSLRARMEAESGRPFNSVLHHAIATQLAPDRHDLWCNRGIDCAGARMFKESEESFKKSLAIEDSFEGRYNYANLLCTLMRIDESVEHYQAAARMQPDHAQLHANMGISLIAQGKWHEGFTAYKHRFNAPGFPPRPRFNYPTWRGQQIEGKTILLYVEQGFGDEIQSLRFCKTVKDKGARVILSVRPPMFRLARNFAYADAVIMQYDDPPWQPDYMLALLDVPGLIDVEPATVPLKAGYIAIEDQGFRLGFPQDVLKVGICWASGKRPDQPSVFEIAKQKSLDFAQFAPLARPGVKLVSLQQSHGDTLEMRRLGVADPMQGVQDFADTAFIIDHIDLVITVDTAVAHLAGALGKPVWNLVRYDAIWPWRKETAETCWYDSMTIYRQPEPFNWREPLKRLMADFGRLVGERSEKAA